MRRIFSCFSAFLLLFSLMPSYAPAFTIAEKLQDLLETKKAIRQAIIDKGINVPSDTPFSQYSAKIAAVGSNWTCPDGGAPQPPPFDGTSCVFTDYSYTYGYSVTWSMKSDDAICNQVSGEGVCATNNGVSGKKGGAPTGDDGRYCYCRMTAPREGTWVFLSAFGSATNCSSYCANDCANDVQGDANFRAAVLGP
jgi:hypothetical protein